MDENALFRTTINGQITAFDPWRVERLLAHGLGGQSVAKVLSESRSQDPDLSFRASELLYSAGLEAFGLLPVQTDGSGSTQKTVWRLLTEYGAWKEALKKNTASSQTSSEPTEAESLPDISALTNSLASGS